MRQSFGRDGARGQEALAEASAGLDVPACRNDRLRDITLSRELGIDAALRRHRHHRVAGFTDDGAPAGISFIGAPWSERRLIALAAACERAGAPRVPPALD